MGIRCLPLLLLLVLALILMVIPRWVPPASQGLDFQFDLTFLLFFSCIGELLARGTIAPRDILIICFFWALMSALGTLHFHYKLSRTQDRKP